MLVVVALLFGPGPGLQVVAWPAVFSCGLCVHLYCSEFYSTQCFWWHFWFITFCRSFLSLLSLTVVFKFVSLGLGLGLGLVLCLSMVLTC